MKQRKVIFVGLALALAGSLVVAETLTATRLAEGSAEALNGETITAAEADKSVLVARNGAGVTAKNVTLEKTGGDTSNEGESNFYGLNAAVVAESESLISLQKANVTTNADGANAVFATGNKSSVMAKNLTIRTQKNSSRGLDATYGGSIVAENVDVVTQGAHSAAFATDRGEGNVTVTGGKAATNGEGSPVIYSTGNITVKNLTGSAENSEIAVIEGKNSVTLEKVKLTGGTKNRRDEGSASSAVMLYQSMSGDANRGVSTFTARNSELTSRSDGAFFYVTNTSAVINLTGNKLTNPNETLLLASGNESNRGWGKPGANGGNVTLHTAKQTLAGNVVSDSISRINLKFGAGTNFTGAINGEKTGLVNLTLARKAKVTLTADSYVNELKDEDASFKNIVSNGHTLYYNKKAKANADLKGRTILLPDGGKLLAYEMDLSDSSDRTKNADKGTKIPLPNREAKKADMQVTSLTGKLTYVGKDDSAATLSTADGKNLTLVLMKRPDRKDVKKGMKGMKGGAGKMPDDAKGMQPPEMGGEPPEMGREPPEMGTDASAMKGQAPMTDRQKNQAGKPPKPLTLDDLKKLDGKTVEVKGFAQKDGGFVVLEASEK